MMYIEDAVQGTIKLMEAKSENVTIRTSYNIQAMAFTPMEIAHQIKRQLPEFEIEYEIDPMRQRIAESWPEFFVDEKAKRDWGWAPKFTL